MPVVNDKCFCGSSAEIQCSCGVFMCRHHVLRVGSWHHKSCAKHYESSVLVPKGKKTPFQLLDFDFCAAICENFKEGVKGDREPNGWKNLDWNESLEDAYFAALVRHVHAFQKSKDSQHLAAIACNANIIHHHITKR